MEKWAFANSSTTKSKDENSEPRGVGLNLLKEFICKYNGKINAYSNSAYVVINKKGENYQKLVQPFNGTVFHIVINCEK